MIQVFVRINLSKIARFWILPPVKIAWRRHAAIPAAYLDNKNISDSEIFCKFLCLNFSKKSKEISKPIARFFTFLF